MSKKTDNILQNGKIVNKTRLPRTTICHSGCIFPLKDLIHYAVYQLDDNVVYKEISVEEYNKINF